jgi:hypothetical protein
LTLSAIVPAVLAADSELLHISPLHARRLVVAGVLDDIEREDEDNGQDGYEDAEDAVFWTIVGAARNDACPICGSWSCNRAGCVGGAATPAPTNLALLAPVAGDGQCSICGGVFDDWNGGICGACKSNGY